ncbi:uncharacterized protein LOC123670741 [Harmonia axyridis]|uniref:uncharacterized protein LOC123670734 n=1 Tax=Harmonia axyridis TaxID=115357 RepID=UPI001E278ED3|nr:uncharacterized protein LOC123670734 [Harmonia axyridis]XP_045460236.1 uncharacterized protein LOC123670741 [Harmonia axyridis]
MGFYHDIATTYGQEEATRLKRWSSNNIKLASARNRRIFLLECKRRNLVPNHINHSIKSVQKLFEIEGGKKLNKKIDNFNNKLTSSISRLEVNHVNLRISHLETANEDIMRMLKDIMSRELLMEFKKRQRILYNKRFHIIKLTNIKKIGKLEEMNKPNWKNQEKWFRNLSSIQIPKEIENFLSLGSKFSMAVPVGEISMDNLIADVEDIIQKTTEKNQDLYRAKVSSIIASYIHKNRDIMYQTDRPYRIAREFLKANENLIILNSDKGAVTVAMDREDYTQKMYTIINSESFKQIPRDPTTTLQNKCNDYNEFYVQTFGCAMGSKLSPILSQYVMDHLLDVCIPLLSFNLIFLKKFVDDLILALPHTGIDEIQQIFNSYDPHIQFTIEREDENKTVPFLDTKVCRINNTIKLDWYRKNSASNKFINYQSEHPIQVKINCVKEMKARIKNICHPDLVDANLKKLYRIFQENSYPRGLLNKLLYESNNNPEQPKPEPKPPETAEGDDNRMPENTKYGSLPNIRDLTSKIKNCFKEENIKIATYNTKSISRLYSRIKDQTPTLLRSNVVYKMNCAECECTYIGHTSQWLKSRLALHKSDITKNNQRCALTIHAVEKGHRIDFDSAEIVATQKKYNKRLILEMINIRNQKDPINKKTDVQKLSNVYTYLLTYPNIKERKNFYDGPLDE